MSESQAVAHYDPSQPPATTSGGVIGSVLALAKDPNTNAANVETLTNLAIRLQDREFRAEFNRAKIAAIREMPAIYKRGQSDKHCYAKFEDLHRAAMPILARHGLSLDFKVGSDGNMITVQPILRHENGHVEEGGLMKGAPDKGPGRSDIQAVGSATSYLKRHSMKAILNIIEDGEDNDGQFGRRDGDQLNDRQTTLIAQAETTAGEGSGAYTKWYGTLPAKDKALLVNLGVHARLGGGAALPSTSSSPIGLDSRPEPEPEDAVVEAIVDEPAVTTDERRAETPAAKDPEPDKSTPDGWTAIYVRDCEKAASLAQLDKVVSAGANGLRKLSEAHPKLWEKADGAMLDARERLAAAPADDDTFPGDR